MIFVKGSHTHVLQGIKADPLEITSPHNMEKILKKDHFRIISQLHSIHGCDTTPIYPPLALQQVLDTYSSVFRLPTGLLPTRGEHDLSIPLLVGSQPPNVHPYRYPFSKINEIENIIKELLSARVIFPSTIPYSSPTVMVLKKEDDWRM